MGDPWTCMAAHGRPLGLPWTPMGEPRQTHVRRRGDLYGSPRETLGRPMEIHGSPRETHGSPLKPMAEPWAPIGAHGIAVEVRGCPWVPTRPTGDPWKSMDAHRGPRETRETPAGDQWKSTESRWRPMGAQAYTTIEVYLFLAEMISE